jgi:Sulfotransferase domain
MTLRVVGAGMGRTGTMSLKLALTRLLGAPCYHMVEVFPRPTHLAMWTDAAHGKKVDWQSMFDGFVAAVDWPVAAFWKELSEVYPDAIILLSTRDAESWWKSASNTIFSPELGQRAPAGPFRDMLDAVMKARFTTDRHNKEAAIAAYEKNNAEVRATAPKARLVEWTSKDGWGPLCAALGVPEPSEPFPHANTTEEFQARLANRPMP